MEHKRRIEHYPDNKQLAEAISNLRYDALADLFNELRIKFSADSNADFERGRPKLSSELSQIAARMRNAQRVAEKAWEICEPYMLMGTYYGHIAEIDEKEQKIWIELVSSNQEDGFKYHCIAPFSSLREEDKSRIALGRTLTLIQHLKSREIIFDEAREWTAEELKQAEERAENLFKNIKWE